MAAEAAKTEIRTVEPGRSRIAEVYAEALMNAAAKTGAVDDVAEELEQFLREVIGASPRVREFLMGRGTGRKARAAALAKATEGRCSTLFKNFLGVLNHNGRLHLLRAIAASYSALRDEAAGRVRVKVASAVQLEEKYLERLTETLARSMKGRPVIDAHVDPELIGGLVVRIGDKVYDTSVRSRLNNLRTHLLASGIHG